MVYSATRTKKPWKVSPPPHAETLLPSLKPLPLIRQVLDEDIGFIEVAPKYFKGRLESRNKMLHSNECRPVPPTTLPLKPSRHDPTRILSMIFAVLLTATIMNYYTYTFKVKNVRLVTRDDRHEENTYTNSRMLYLDGNYKVVSSSSWSLPKKHRKILNDYPTEQTDVTQLYGTASSNDVRLQSMEMKFFPEHETNKNCVPMSKWQLMSFPTCNLFHEMMISDHQMLASGNWRHTWLNENNGDKVIVKTIKYEHTFQERYYEFSRVDALAMERLTSNPFIMGVHGFCGVSVATEQGKYEIGSVVGKLKPRDRLIVAIQVAASIAAVHGIDGIGKPASLVHNDININNIFWGDHGPLLNDFNIAVLMMKDKQTNQSCSFTGHFPNPQWKAPEEQSRPDGTSIKQLDEKVDVYALGNLLFRFATGKAPWREFATSTLASFTREQKKQIAYLKSVKGAIPNIPKEVKELDDPYIKVILETMKMCYRYHPKERPTAHGVARFMQMSLEELDGTSNKYSERTTLFL